jgi:hypothetical protein
MLQIILWTNKDILDCPSLIAYEFIAGPTARTQQFAFVAVTFVAVVFVAIAFVAVAFVAVTFVAVTFVAVTFMTIALSKYISIYTLTFTSILR